MPKDSGSTGGGGGGASALASGGAAAAASGIGAAENRILRAILEDTRGDINGLGSVAFMRPLTGLSKEEFDSVALQMRREGLVVFSQHPHVASLTPSEVNNLIHDGRGNYFNGIAVAADSRGVVQRALGQ